ncbi:glycoside hydrolase family 65 protein [Fictibacillus barbaricus]|uniref:Glycoside hydrolase family 65 protein n=1 Tax=Fictibacillus barbaricus TaxID=182136 RepID=A0ABS2ZGX9_9BACL|nr:glycoside hydrolase family 65 protein [Fictibacillus barbaricus]MBN3546579.1 glycoside hydrolase family 65 protein [Fictibacillus barbaricus]GGB42142.1 maltose phosphorylase [Fictibacillus barbaricus]
MNKQQTVTEEIFSIDSINKYASLMTLGNGYLGLRASHEEEYTDQIKGMYAAGIYNKATNNGISEIVNLPDLTAIRIEIDGELFSLLDGEILSYHRELSLLDGQIKREVVWKSRSGAKYQLIFQRFVSKDDLHLVGMKVTVTSLDKQSKLKIVTGIDAQQTNFGNQHLLEENVRVFDERIMQGTFQTSESGHQIAITASCSCTGDADTAFVAKNRQLYTTVTANLPLNEPFILEKLCTIHTSLDDETGLDLETTGVQTLQKKLAEGYDDLLSKSAQKWKEFWDRKQVKITSEHEFDQFALDFALYHIEIMTPAHDERFSVGAKGLTGPGYKGHIFWDTEIFILPHHLFTQPETARKLLRYRYLHLQQAIEKAHQNGYEGALFPWESAFTGVEETPEFAAINIRTGKRQKVASAIAEHHIVADIAFAVVHYYQATHDDEFMKKEGLALLKETSRFWISRACEEDGKLSIQDVIGPDEYTEHINNNAYTNYMAHFNVKQTLNYMKRFKDADESLLAAGEDFLNRLYLPKPGPDNIIPQDDTFLKKPEIDLSKYKMNQGSQGILLDYSRQEVNEMQILKQADVVMLLYLFPDLFSSDVVAENLQYYEEHTIHDSSLSKAIHAIVAARCGEKEEAYRFFKEACLIDLGPNPHSSDEGLHAASLGAIWLATVFGFANVSIVNDRLSIDPKLPTEWTELEFPIIWQGTRLNITITQQKMTILKLSGPDVQLDIRGTAYQVTDKIEVGL